MIDVWMAWNLDDIVTHWELISKGLWTTMMLAIAVYGFSFGVSLLMSLARYLEVLLPQSSISRWIKGSVDTYVYLLRSVPLIMLVALIHYGILPSMGLQYSFFFSAFVAFSLSTIAYLTEILRGGFEALRREELESAASLGLSVWQRFLYVFIPLILARTMPALVNQGITLIKDTSLASIIGVIELTRSTEIIYERTLHELTLLIFTAVVYFVICTTLSKVAQAWAKMMPAR